MKPIELLDNAARFGLSRRVVAFLILLSLVSTAIEGLGVGLILPIAQLMISGETPANLIETSRIWQWIDSAHGVFRMSVSLASLFSACAILIVLRQIFVYGREIIFNRVKFRLLCENQVNMLGGFLRSRTGYQETIAVGDFANEMVTELHRAISCTFSLVIFVSFGLQIAFYFGLMLLLSTEMTLAAIVVLCCVAAILRGLMERTEIAGRSLFEANRDLTTYFVERLSRARLIKLCGLADAEQIQMDHLAQNQRMFNFEVAVLQSRLSVLIEPLVILSGLSLVYFSYTYFGLGLAELGLFLVITFRLLPVFRTLLLTRQSFFANLASVRMILKRMDELEENKESDLWTDAKFAHLSQGIEFRNVYFSYQNGTDTDVTALRGITIQIPAGKITALVGPSGSGKSTLIDLIPRVREPQSGTVLIDGIPVDQLELGELRRQIAYTPQSPVMLDVTIAEHIRFGDPNATDDQIERALQLAGIADFVADLPAKSNTRMGTGGGRLSGGQRQRIDLTRALVSPAKILIFDEPTSNLDADAEHKFRITLDLIRRETDLTVIVVGHQFVTTQVADQLIVMQNGEVRESGDHESLLRKNGWYSQAYRKQMGNLNLDPPAAIGA